MNELDALKVAYEDAVAEFAELMSRQEAVPFQEEDRFEKGVNTIALGDNQDLMLDLLLNKKMAGAFQLIYIDPPFFAKEKFASSIKLKSGLLGDSPVLKIGAYDDHRRESLRVYLTRLALRLMLMRELLSDTGLLWIHLDRRVTHYARILMDLIFGAENYVNEVIWTYKSGGASKRTFARKHDNLLVFSKTRHYKFHPLKEKSYNRGMKPYRFKGVQEYEDELGWYTMVNMKDVWQLDMVGRTSSERNGYATQKPETLLERIISSCTDPGDLCADFYAGSGTLAAVCEKMGRGWVLCDNHPAAVVCQIERMRKSEDGFRVLSGRSWPEGTLTLDSGLISDYKADLSDISCSDKELLERYMEEDGPCFIRLSRYRTEGESNWITGYDILGNRFRQEIK